MNDSARLHGCQIAAARVLLGIEQQELAAMARISVPTLRRMEFSVGPASEILNNALAVQAALESAGTMFEERDGRLWVGVPASYAADKSTSAEIMAKGANARSRAEASSGADQSVARGRAARWLKARGWGGYR